MYYKKENWQDDKVIKLFVIKLLLQGMWFLVYKEGVYDKDRVQLS